MKKYLFIGYPGCSTCRAARKGLEEHQIEFEERHIAEQKPTEEELLTWLANSDLAVQKFFNTGGWVYKSLQLKNKLPEMNEREKIHLLATDGMLIKRPLLVGKDRVWVGFKPENWSQEVL